MAVSQRPQFPHTGLGTGLLTALLFPKRVVEEESYFLKQWLWLLLRAKSKRQEAVINCFDWTGASIYSL